MHLRLGGAHAPIGVGAIAITALLLGDLPTDTSTTFSGSGNCAVCHEPSSVAPTALVDPETGADVSPVTLWRSTMMANAAKDPFWQAKVTAEVAANPELREVIEDKCTTCHAPAGRTEAAMQGASYSLAEMMQDPLALDGVTCTVCHQIKDEDLGEPESFSGNYEIENDRIIYGPFDDQLIFPMRGSTNYTPTYSEHVTRSGLCATCHTLFTPFVDNEGTVVGELPEQVPFLEWKNSIYSAQNRDCQDCHMPVIDSAIPITTIPPTADARGPFWKHYFVGGNVTMLRLLRDNIDPLGLTADGVDFDSTIARTVRQLGDSTASLDATYDWMGDTLAILVSITNRSGHKLPTGFPSRRMWLHVLVSDQDGNTVFESGEWNQDGEVLDAERPFEPHRTLVSSDDEVQIYESVMVDVDNEVTYTLLRGSRYIKDNRIPPIGFTTAHADYAFAAIRGAAVGDDDFNRSGAVEGSGTDIVTYHVGGLTNSVGFTAEISLLYQSVTPDWTNDLSRYENDEIDAFLDYYDQTDRLPTVVGSVELSPMPTASIEEVPPSDTGLVVGPAYPNPFSASTTFTVDAREQDRISARVFDISGRSVRRFAEHELTSGSIKVDWDGKDDVGVDLPAGVYIVRLTSLKGSRSIVVHKAQ